jgi:hypothetical protein
MRRRGAVLKILFHHSFLFCVNVFCHCEEPGGRRGKSLTNFVRLKVHCVNFPLMGVIVSRANNYQGNRRLPEIRYACNDTSKQGSPCSKLRLRVIFKGNAVSPRLASPSDRNDTNSEGILVCSVFYASCLVYKWVLFSDSYS